MIGLVTIGLVVCGVGGFILTWFANAVAKQDLEWKDGAKAMFFAVLIQIAVSIGVTQAGLPDIVGGWLAFGVAMVIGYFLNSLMVKYVYGLNRKKAFEVGGAVQGLLGLAFSFMMFMSGVK